MRDMTTFLFWGVIIYVLWHNVPESHLVFKEAIQSLIAVLTSLNNRL